MPDGSQQGFEIPPEMRSLAEHSVEQAKKAFDGFMAAAQQAVDRFESRTEAARAGAKDMRTKAVGYAESNIEKSFEFARNLTRAKSAEEVMRLHTEYVTAQMHALSEQAKELGQCAVKTGSSVSQS